MEDGTPKTLNEQATGEMEITPYDPETGLPMDEDSKMGDHGDFSPDTKGAMSKMGAKGRGQGEDPVESKLGQILDYLTKTLDPKVPQHVLS